MTDQLPTVILSTGIDTRISGIAARSVTLSCITIFQISGSTRWRLCVSIAYYYLVQIFCDIAGINLYNTIS